MTTDGAVIGVGRHPWAPSVADELIRAAAKKNTLARIIDLPSCQTTITSDGRISVSDSSGTVRITHIAPALLYRLPSAVIAYRALEMQELRFLNSVESTLLADDKARTTLTLAGRSIPQIPTAVVPLEAKWPTTVHEGHRPVGIAKLAHGAQGRWVRRIDGSEDQAEAVRSQFRTDGPSSVLLQPFEASAGRSTKRLIVLESAVIAWTLRTGGLNEWRSNVSNGAHQESCDISIEEAEMAIKATRACGLGFAGVDIIESSVGPAVLEVNAAPGFPSMKPWTNTDIGARIITALLEGKSDGA